MTAYRNCEVSEVMPVTLPSGVAGAGYGFSIRSENKRPLVTLSSLGAEGPSAALCADPWGYPAIGGQGAS